MHIQAMIAAFRQAGHRITTVEPALGGENRLNILGRVKAALPGVVRDLLECVYAIRAYHKLCRIIKDDRPDFIYERHNLFLPSGVWAARKFGIPLIIEVNAPLSDERISHGQLSLKRLARWIESYTWQKADAVITVTDVLKEIVKGRGVAPQQIHVMHNAVVLADYNSMSNRSGDSARHITIGFIGYVRTWHQLDRVIEVLARTNMDNWRLIIAGDGPALISLKKQARALGIANRVIFTGVIARADIPAFLHTIDIALQPGGTPYASPLKLFEYMAAGCAIIAVDQPNIREILQNGENALLVDAENDRAIKDAIMRLLKSDHLRTQLGAAAKRRIVDQPYTWDHNAQRTIDIFEQLKP